MTNSALPAPTCGVGSNGIVTLITDAVLGNYAASGGIPFFIVPPSGSHQQVKLWGHVTPEPLNPDNGNDVLLAQGPLAANGQDTPINVPTTAGIFQKNQNVDIYYTLDEDIVNISSPICITVGRDTLRPPQLNTTLKPAAPSMLKYSYDLWSQGITLDVTVVFRADNSLGIPQLGDYVYVFLCPLGALPINMNHKFYDGHPLLVSTEIIESDVEDANPDMILRFKGTVGRQGYLAHRFTNCMLSNAELYVQWLSGGQFYETATQWWQSPSQYIQIDTMPPP